MSLLPKRDGERRPPMLSFRCPTALRKRIEEMAKARGYSRTVVIVRLLEFGLDLLPALESSWATIEDYAREERLPFYEAVARLASEGVSTKGKKRR